jgi:hypothetical protein
MFFRARSSETGGTGRRLATSGEAGAFGMVRTIGVVGTVAAAGRAAMMGTTAAAPPLSRR